MPPSLLKKNVFVPEAGLSLPNTSRMVRSTTARNLIVSSFPDGCSAAGRSNGDMVTVPVEENGGWFIHGEGVLIPALLRSM